mmetsp:Transcript_29572/g.71455  ORF Transcript_29572/g.71455 Transcript_29572/m.71455 type:complete len:562 (-) Transcript_29572:95-1780(-)
MMMMAQQQQQQQQSAAAVPVSQQPGRRQEYNHDRFFHQQQRHFLHSAQVQRQQLVQQQQQQQQVREHVYPMYHQHYQRNPVSSPRMMMMTPLATPRIANMMAAMSPYHYHRQQEPHPRTVTMPVLPDLQHHSQLQQQDLRSPPKRKNSDVSSLPFPGSIVPDPYYNPEQDPFNDHRPFVPPLEIEVPTMPTICASTPTPLAQVKVALVHRYEQSHEQHQHEVSSPTEAMVEGNTESSCLSPVASSNDYSSHRPDWLQLQPHKQEKAKKKKTKKKQKQKPSNKKMENKKKGEEKKEDKLLSPRSPQSPCCISMELEQSASYIHHHSTRRVVDDDDVAAAAPPTDTHEDDRTTESRAFTDHGLNYKSYHQNPGLISPSSSGKGQSRYMLHVNTTSPTTKTAPTMMSDDEKEGEDEYHAASFESSDDRNEDGVTNSRPVLRYSWSPRSSNKKTPKTSGAKAEAKDLSSQKGAGGGQQQQQQQAKQERKGMVRREFRRRYLWFRRGGKKATTTPRNNSDVSSDIDDDIRWSSPPSSPTFSASSSSSDSVSLTCSSGGARYGSQVV